MTTKSKDERMNDTCQSPFGCKGTIYETKSGSKPEDPVNQYPRKFSDGDKLLCEKCTMMHRAGAASIQQPGISSFSTKELEDELNKRKGVSPERKPFDPWKK